jgi:yecA family protein
MTSHVSLTAPELDELQTILLSGTNDDRLELSGLHGLQTAVVSSPQPITPDEWLPLVGDTRPERMLSLVMRQMNGIAAELAHDPASFAPLLLASDATTPREEYAGAWCNGYLAGVLLRGNEWENFLGERTVEDGLSLIAIGSEDFPRSKLPPGLDRTALHDGLAEAAVAIHHFFQQHR